MGSRTLQSCRASARPVLRQCRVHAVQKDTEISTKDWRAQRMADKVHALFDRVWSKGEVQLVDDLITDDFVWKVGTQHAAVPAQQKVHVPKLPSPACSAHLPAVTAAHHPAICVDSGRAKHMATGISPAAMTRCICYPQGRACQVMSFYCHSCVQHANIKVQRYCTHLALKLCAACRTLAGCDLDVQ
jgi:hypothetical protein